MHGVYCAMRTAGLQERARDALCSSDAVCVNACMRVCGLTQAEQAPRLQPRQEGLWTATCPSGDPRA